MSSQEIEKPLNKYVPFPLRLPEIYVEKLGSRWYFSKETIEKIDELYAETFPWEFTWLQKKFPNLFKEIIFGVLIWKPIGVILLLVLCTILYFILNPLIFFILKSIQNIIFKKSGVKSFEILHELVRPIVFIILVRIIKKNAPFFSIIEL